MEKDVQHCCEYTDLLLKIGMHFGFAENQSSELMSQVYSMYLNYHHSVSDHQNTFKMALAKNMVRLCVRHISCKVFAEQRQIAQLVGNYHERCYHTPGEYHNMPFSCQPVYILLNLIGLQETEVSQILNISVKQVKDRAAFAVTYLRNAG